MFLKWFGLILFGAGVFGLSYIYSKKILEWFRFQSIGVRDFIVERFDLMFYEITPGKALGYMIGITAGFFIFGFLIALPKLWLSFIIGTILGIIGWKLPKPVVEIMYQRRIKKSNEQMVDGLGLLANALKSGLSLIQACGIIVDEMPNPISQEFNLILSQNKLGVSVEDTFQNLAKRVPCEDVQMFVTSIVILKETGGNMAETFDTIVHTIRERIKISQKISALTTQGILQGVIVLCIPFVMGISFYLTDPEFMAPMFKETLGWVMIAAMLTLQFVGGFAIWKITQIKV